jgi:hypothetical protein
MNAPKSAAGTAPPPEPARPHVLRRWALWMCSLPDFEVVVMALILANCLVLALYDPLQDEDRPHNARLALAGALACGLGVTWHAAADGHAIGPGCPSATAWKAACTGHYVLPWLKREGCAQPAAWLARRHVAQWHVHGRDAAAHGVCRQRARIPV